MNPTDDASTPDERLSGRSVLWLLLYGATLLLNDFGPGWVLTYHEAFYAEPARAMLESGDWLIPRYLGIPAWDKPPLTHWTIAASMALFRSDSEFVIRLPTILATLAIAWLIASLAARWLGDRIGLLAGLVQLTTFFSLMQSRLAESDTMLLLGVSGAMTALAIGVVDRPPESRPTRWLSVAYFGSMGLGFLAKGPAAPALIGGGSLMFALLARRRAVWRFLLGPLGWAIFLLLAVGWTVAAYRVDPGILEAMRAHNLDRFVKGRVSDQFVKSQVEDVVGHEPFFYYFYTIPALFLPWTPWAIYGAVRGLRGGWGSRELRLLMVSWFAVGLALISASAFKHKHYAIPILPPLAVTAAVGLSAHIFGSRPRSSGRALAAASALVAVGSVAIGTGLASGSSSMWTRLGPILVVIGVGYGLAFYCRRIDRPSMAPIPLFGAIWLVVCLVRSTILPSHDLYLDQARLARRANELVPARPPIYVVGTNYSQMTYYLRRPLIRVDDWREFARIAGDSPPGSKLYAVAPEKILAPLGSIGEVRVLDGSRTFDHMKVLEIRPDRDRVARSGGTEFRR